MYLDDITELSKAGSFWFVNIIDLPREDPRRKKPECSRAISMWFSDFEKALSGAFIEEL